MLTGVRPFDGGDRRRRRRARFSTGIPISSRPRIPTCPAGIDDMLRRALAKPPEHRYPSMTAFAADLSRSRSRRPVSDARRPPDEPSRPAPIAARVPASERRRAAVLVTIVSDYGALVERMTPADAHRLVAQMRDMAVEVVRRHGGLVNQAIGEEIVSLFGVPTAHDDDELRAVRAALELHARVRELRTTRCRRTPMRDPVGPARRPGRRPAAERGPAPLRHRRRAGHGGVEAGRAGRARCLVLQPGVPAARRAVRPHRAVRAGGARARRASRSRRFASPARPGSRRGWRPPSAPGLTPYVGRESELALLESYVERARARRRPGDCGRRRSGRRQEPAAARASRARRGGLSGVRLLNGRCRAYGDVAPYFPFIEIVRERPGQCGRSRSTIRTTSSRAFARSTPSLEPFLPLYLHLLSVPSESHPLPRHLQGEHLQAALLDALAALFTALARRATLVVLLRGLALGGRGVARRARAGWLEIVPTHARSLFVVTTRPERGSLEQLAGQRHADAARAARLRRVGGDHASRARVAAGVGRAGAARLRAHRRQSLLPRAGVSRAASSRAR